MIDKFTEVFNYFVSQIIVTSKLWRPVHHEIYYDKTKDFLIFGAAFDLAIAAKTKFDVMFLDKRKMSSPDSQNYKMRLVLRTFRVQLETLRGIQLFFLHRKN